LLLGLTPVAAVRAVFALCFVLGGLGVYAWLRPRMGDRAAGLAGVVYTLMPSFLTTVYTRGSLADALVMALLPLALAGIATYTDSRSLSAAAIAVLCLLWIWRVQAGLAVLVTLLLLVYAWRVERSWLAVLVVAVTAAAALVSLIPLWPVGGPPPVVFADHFVDLAQWLGGRRQDGDPLQLGFAVVAFGLAALWLWRLRATGRRKNTPARLLAFSAGGSLVLLALSLPLSARLWQWSGAARLLTYPWQVVIPAAPLLAAVAGSLPVLTGTLRRSPAWLALAALVVIGGMPYLTPVTTRVAPGPRPVAEFGPNHEIVLLAATLTEYPVTGWTALDVTWQVLHPLPADYSVFFQALTPEASGETVLAQIDVQPLAGTRPASTWRPGEIFHERYRLAVDRTAQPGALRYYFGYYDWRTGARLPFDGGIGDKLVLYGE
jgi:hypothetical protein